MRAASRLLKASTQLAVALATWSFAAESATVSAGTEVGVAVTRAGSWDGGSYSTRRPAGRERVRLIQVDAACASSAWIVTQSGFAVRRKNALAFAVKSKLIRLSS